MASKSLTIDHPAIGVPNLQVVKLMISLKSRDYVRENFCWHHHYFYLTDAGIEYLRDYLHLPSDIIPATLKKQMPAARPEGEGGDKNMGAGGDFRASFRGGRGRDDGYRRDESGAGGFGRGAAM